MNTADYVYDTRREPLIRWAHTSLPIDTRPKVRIVAISGHAGSGKDTAGKMLRDALQMDGHRVLLTHYADLLKYICKSLFQWDGEKDTDGRSLLQTVGTDVIRAECPNYWVDFIGDMLGFFPGLWDYVIIPDARFPNEITRLRERGFRVIHLEVVRPGYTSELSPEQLEHPSETALNGVRPDYSILNDCDLNTLESRLTSWVAEVLYEKE